MCLSEMSCLHHGDLDIRLVHLIECQDNVSQCSVMSEILDCFA